MQELWLFGQLRTLESSDVQSKVVEDAKVVAALLDRLTGASGQDGVKVGA